jgi:hypothetical protein
MLKSVNVLFRFIRVNERSVSHVPFRSDCAFRLAMIRHSLILMFYNLGYQLHR